MQIGRWQTEAARDLLRYLSERKISLTRFCEENELDRIAVMRAVRGVQPKRVSVDFALAIKRATKGRVRVELWGSDTIRVAKAA